MTNTLRSRLLWLLKFLLLPSIFFAQNSWASYWDACTAQDVKSCGKTPQLQELIPLTQNIITDSKAAKAEVVSLKNDKFSRENVIPDEVNNSELGSDINISVDPSVKFQEIWGFGASVTEACLANLDKMPADKRKKLMQDLFSRDSGAGFSYLRVPLGSNDFSDGSYTLNDTEGNKPDPNLKKFDKSKLTRLLDFVKEAKAINPSIKVLVSPWTPPAWMKKNKSLNGGELEPKYHGAYAKYLKKSVDTFKENGIAVDHMTIMNEPTIGWAKDSWDFPQAYMSVDQQQKFLANDLAPYAKAQKDFPKILVHDHNFDNAVESLKLVKDPKIKSMVAGVGMHCYGGGFTTQQEALARFSPINGFNTECSGTMGTDMAETFEFWLKTQSVDSLRAGSSGSGGWTLCVDEHGGPPDRGCKTCKGLVTIDQKNNQKVIFNPEFEALAFSSRAVQSGAVQIQSNYTNMSGLTNVAIKNPDGKIVVLMRNSNDKPMKVSLKVQPCKNSIQVEVPAKSATSVYF